MTFAEFMEFNQVFRRKPHSVRFDNIAISDKIQTGNNLRLSLQSQSSVSGTVYRLPISVHNAYSPGSRSDTIK